MQGNITSDLKEQKLQAIVRGIRMDLKLLAAANAVIRHDLPLTANSISNISDRTEERLKQLEAL